MVEISGRKWAFVIEQIFRAAGLSRKGFELNGFINVPRGFVPTISPRIERAVSRGEFLFSKQSLEGMNREKSIAPTPAGICL